MHCTLNVLSGCLAPYPGLLDTVPVDALLRFVRLASRLRREIELHCPDPAIPPARLPVYIHDFLRLSSGLSEVTAIHCWTALRDTIWGEVFSLTDVVISRENSECFLSYGDRAARIEDRLGAEDPPHFCACSLIIL
jgi:hypothetical protein